MKAKSRGYGIARACMLSLNPRFCTRPTDRPTDLFCLISVATNAFFATIFRDLCHHGSVFSALYLSLPPPLSPLASLFVSQMYLPLGGKSKASSELFTSAKIVFFLRYDTHIEFCYTNVVGRLVVGPTHGKNERRNFIARVAAVSVVGPLFRRLPLCTPRHL